ncbi:helix-turn-helix domain-containing protein [Candidatus Aminicenantes bacterium AC-334-K16]|jgi:hypothetical protein|nr:helix-turn-helix domain-containing protein [Candidatus Aminicenantes bacterium AC-334-K16]
MKVPCELIIWNVLPAIRREFARILVQEFNLSQREVAAKLGITESAVSQYLKMKRGQKLQFDQAILKEIRKAMKDVSTTLDNTLLIEKTCRICSLVRHHGLLCQIHRGDTRKLDDCQICLGDDLTCL